MNKRIVAITGCLGFIGSHLTRTCLNLGWYVWGIDKLTYAAHPELIEEFSSAYGDRFMFTQQDINDISFLYDVDYFINTAAESHVDNAISNSSVFLKSNINGVRNLLELIRVKNEKPIFLQFGTDEEYGEIPEGSHKETDVLNPGNPYAASKASASHLVTSWSRTYKLPYIIVRPTNNWGCFQYVEKLIPKTCKYLQLGKKIPLHDKGTPRRMWLNAKDTSRAVVKIIESGVTNEIFNISGNYEAQNIEVVKKIAFLHFGKEIDPEEYCDFSYVRDGQDTRYSVDDSKLRSLGWENECVFDNEIPHVVEYYKENFIW